MRHLFNHMEYCDEELGAVVRQKSSSSLSAYGGMVVEVLRNPNNLKNFLKSLFIQTVIWWLAFLVYCWLRMQAIAGKEVAFENAKAVVRLEEALGLFLEPRLQQFLFSHSQWLIVLCNQYYAHAHLLPTFLFFVWLFAFHRAHFAFVRDGFYLTNVFASFGYFFFPCAPPRFMPELGFVDTLKMVSGIDFYAKVNKVILANQYAAVPSMHFGWHLIVWVTVWRLRDAKHSWAVLGFPGFMFLSIVVTGNHFIFDGIAGGFCVVLGFLIVSSPAAKRWYFPKDNSHRSSL